MLEQFLSPPVDGSHHIDVVPGSVHTLVPLPRVADLLNDLSAPHDVDQGTQRKALTRGKDKIGG